MKYLLNQGEENMIKNSRHNLGKSKYTKRFQKYMKNINMHAMMQNYKINKSNLETNFQKTENTFLQNKNADFIIDLNINNMQNKKSLDKNKTYKQF